jgi:chaperonin cofactor prefoldin
VTAPSSEELREAIAREEARVARLEDERRLAQDRLDALRGELAACGIDSGAPPT